MLPPPLGTDGYVFQRINMKKSGREQIEEQPGKNSLKLLEHMLRRRFFSEAIEIIWADYEEKILKVFFFPCHDIQSSAWVQKFWRNLKKGVNRMCSVKFQQNRPNGFRREDF